MAESAYEAATRLAKHLRDRCWGGDLPVRLTDISRSLRAVKFEERLLSPLRGVASQNAQNGTIVVLNSALGASHRRYVWAQLLGRIVDNREHHRIEPWSHTDDGQDADVFSVAFAGELLIPDEELARLTADGLTTAQIAITFAVPVGAVELRRELLRATNGTSAGAGRA